MGCICLEGDIFVTFVLRYLMGYFCLWLLSCKCDRNFCLTGIPPGVMDPVSVIWLGNDQMFTVGEITG